VERRSDRVLSNCRVVHAFAPHRVFPKQRIPVVNDCIAQREIITAQTTRLARPDTRYTIVIQYYVPGAQMNDSIRARLDATFAFVSVFLSLSLSLLRRENVHRVHIGSATRTIASLLEAIRDESPPWYGVHRGNGVVGCGSYIPAEINSEQRGI